MSTSYQTRSKMAAVFSDLGKLKESAVMHTREWTSHVFEKYKIPEKPHTPSGKGANAPYEDLNIELYNPNANMLGFRVKSHERLLYWIKAIGCRYYLSAGEVCNFVCEWVDKKNENDEVNEVFIQLKKRNSKYADYDTETDEKLITFHIYPNTHLITVQGQQYVWWADHEFHYLKNIVDIADGIRVKHTEQMFPPTENILLNDSSCADDKDFKSVLGDDSITFVKKISTSTPRVVSPKPVLPNDIQSVQCEIKKMNQSIQMLECEVCKILPTVSCLEEKFTTLTEKNIEKTMQITLERYLDPILKENIQLRNELHELKTNTQKEIKLLQKDVAVLKSQTMVTISKSWPQTRTCENEVMFETSHQKHVDGVQKQYTHTCLSTEEDTSSMPTEHPNEISEPTKPLSRPSHKIEIVMDSHGNGIDPRRMYKNQDINIHVLGAGKKNLEGAMQYVQSLESPQHIVVGVGSNDIATKSSESIVTQIENLVVCAQKKQCSVHILSLLERMDQEDYNDRVRTVNDKLSESLKDTENVYFIRVDSYLNAENPQLYGVDGVHLNDDGRKTLVKLMKDHLNHKLGMKPYKDYGERSENSERNSNHAGEFSNERTETSYGRKRTNTRRQHNSRNGGYMQNGPHNHWYRGPQNRGPRYNDLRNGPHNHWYSGPQNRGPRYIDGNKTQGDYLTSKQKQLSTVFNQLLKMIQ